MPPLNCLHGDTSPYSMVVWARRSSQYPATLHFYPQAHAHRMSSRIRLRKGFAYPAGVLQSIHVGFPLHSPIPWGLAVRICHLRAYQLLSFIKFISPVPGITLHFMAYIAGLNKVTFVSDLAFVTHEFNSSLV